MICHSIDRSGGGRRCASTCLFHPCRVLPRLRLRFSPIVAAVEGLEEHDRCARTRENIPCPYARWNETCGTLQHEYMTPDCGSRPRRHSRADPPALTESQHEPCRQLARPRRMGIRIRAAHRLVHDRRVPCSLTSPVYKRLLSRRDYGPHTSLRPSFRPRRMSPVRDLSIDREIQA